MKYIGAITGDIIGSIYEWDNIKTTEFPLFDNDCFFTDDSVLTLATMDAITNNIPYEIAYHKFATNYPGRGYGGGFSRWLHSDLKPYNSYGNGAGMRVSPVGWAFDTSEEVIHQATESAKVTHNHPEGIKGAQATALSVFLARTGKSKDDIRYIIEETFGYNLHRTCDEIRPTYTFNETCQGTVPEAIIAFLDSTDFENAIRLAISLGGDSDTLACITGGIAEAFYGEVPKHISDEVERLLPPELLYIIKNFNN